MNPAPRTDARCPRCGQAFCCGLSAPGPCECTTVALSAALQARLRAQFQGCLCMECLRELIRAEADAGPPPEAGAR